MLCRDVLDLMLRALIADLDALDERLRDREATSDPAVLAEGARVVRAAIAALGATPINYRTEDFTKIMAAEEGADLILDMVGGSYIPKNIKALAPDGRLVMIAFLEGPKVELNFAQIMAKRLTVTGSTLRPQSDAAKAEIAEALRKRLWPLISAGSVKVRIDSEFDLADVVQAHRRMESSQHIGKIVLKVGGDSA